MPPPHRVVSHAHDASLTRTKSCPLRTESSLTRTTHLARARSRAPSARSRLSRARRISHARDAVHPPHGVGSHARDGLFIRATLCGVRRHRRPDLEARAEQAEVPIQRSGGQLRHFHPSCLFALFVVPLWPRRLSIAVRIPGHQASRSLVGLSDHEGLEEHEDSEAGIGWQGRRTRLSYGRRRPLGTGRNLHPTTQRTAPQLPSFVSLRALRGAPPWPRRLSIAVRIPVFQASRSSAGLSNHEGLEEHEDNEAGIGWQD